MTLSPDRHQSRRSLVHNPGLSCNFQAGPEVSPRRSAAPRSRLVFDRLRNFPGTETDIAILLTWNIPQPIESSTDLACQLVKFPGWF